MSPTPSPLLHTLLIPYLIFGPAFSFTDVSSNNPLHLLTQMRVLAELQDREKTRAHGKGRREGGAAPTYTCIHPSCNHVFSREGLESWTCRQIFSRFLEVHWAQSLFPLSLGFREKPFSVLQQPFCPRDLPQTYHVLPGMRFLTTPLLIGFFPLK